MLLCMRKTTIGFSGRKIRHTVCNRDVSECMNLHAARLLWNIVVYIAMRGACPVAKSAIPVLSKSIHEN